MSKPTEITGLTTGVYLGLDPDSLVTTRQAHVRVTFEGFDGDKHAGFTRPADSRTPHYPRGAPIRNDRQVSIVSIEELEQIAAALDVAEIRPEWLGANLALQGIPRLTLLPPNTRLVFAQGAVLVVQQENLPCSGPGKVIQKQYDRPGLDSAFPKAALHLRGLVACVERPGIIAEGDAVIV
jgi:hypothetical protein